jgi:hypothetical protein
MKLFQLITYSQGYFEQTFYKTAKDLIEDLGNVLDDFPSFQNELEDFISESIEDLEDSKPFDGKKLEFEDKSFVRIEFIDTDEID